MYKRFSELTLVVSTLLVIFIGVGDVRAQDDLRVIQGESSNNNWHQFSDAPNALYHHIAGQAYDSLDDRNNEIAELELVSDWKERQSYVREKLEDILGPFPDKTPLNAEVVRTIRKDDYVVEHIRFESQPEFYVTSSLFIPRGLESRAPAIVYASGHSQEAYRSEVYQHEILNLVKKGFIVFAFDPVGQGERLQYYDQSHGGSVVGSSTREHSYVGAQAFIAGSSLARYMTWDGIRAVDYLLSREEVDSSRIGITGRSGGGTQAAYVAAIDDRIHAAAPESYITSFTRLLQSIGPQDAEQNLYHGIKHGIDHADLLEVRAPKPNLVLSTTEDFFSIQGARETSEEVSKVYEAYDKSDSFGMVEDGGGHSSTKKNREAKYAFFQEHLDSPGDPSDQEVEMLSEEELQITSTGQVLSAIGGETVFSLNRQEAQEHLNELRSSRENIDSHIPEVLEKARVLSGYREPDTISEPVFIGNIQREGYVVEKYFARGEGDYAIPYLLMVPDDHNGKAVIYLHPSGKASEASEGGEIEWFVKNGFAVLAPDLVGVGELGSGDLANYVTQIEGFDETSFDVWPASVLIGRSVVGIQASDVVRLTRLLKSSHGMDEMYGFARQEMSPVLLHAAAFDQSISRIALLEPFASYRSIVENRFYNPGFHISTVAGALEAYDLPDLAASLAPRELMIAGVTDGAGNPTGSESINEDVSVIEAAYQYNSAYEKLTITFEPAGEPYDLLLNWIE